MKENLLFLYHLSSNCYRGGDCVILPKIAVQTSGVGGAILKWGAQQ